MGAEKSYPVDTWVRLFRALNGTQLAASELYAGRRRPGAASWSRAAAIAFLEAEQSRLGASADRGLAGTTAGKCVSRRTRSRRRSRATARWAPCKDVVPRRLGVSGRVVELAVARDRRRALLTGLRVRWGLGLRENLFVVDRELDGAGDVARFVFTGKGWGHGVGLCQVGASGMAQAGSTYDRILQHYYSGHRGAGPP